MPRIEGRIQVIRDLRVIIDVDLAMLYGVLTKVLNQAVKRNAGRFPSDFLFQLTLAEKTEVVTNCDHLQKLKFSKTLPYAFTEHRGFLGSDSNIAAQHPQGRPKAGQFWTLTPITRAAKRMHFPNRDLEDRVVCAMLARMRSRKA